MKCPLRGEKVIPTCIACNKKPRFDVDFEDTEDVTYIICCDFCYLNTGWMGDPKKCLSKWCKDNGRVGNEKKIRGKMDVERMWEEF